MTLAGIRSLYSHRGTHEISMFAFKKVIKMYTYVPGSARVTCTTGTGTVLLYIPVGFFLDGMLVMIAG